jgi:pyruvate/2-oxoglutarate dehydrogenase complex dihydrolipoamide acyltransferase (E2) component
MRVKMKMPDLATSADTVTVLQWLVEVGQPIKRGQPLLEIETDKAAMEVESFAAGILSEIHVGPEDEVEVGAVIATLEVGQPA